MSADAFWLGLPGSSLGPPAPDLRRWRLVFDVAAAPATPTVLLEQRGGGAVLSLLHDRGLGFGMMLRHAGSVWRLMLPGARADDGGGMLDLRWSQKSEAGTLVWQPAAGPANAVRASGLAGYAAAGLAGLIASGATSQRHPSLGWFALTADADLPPPGPRLGPRTPVQTPGGAVPAQALRPGDVVLTRDRGPVALLGTARTLLPGRGKYAPVRLRSPYFLRGTDALVSPEQPVALSGVEVEYLFGEDEVLVEARHLADGARAIREDHPGLLPWITLELERPALLLCDGCAVGAGPAGLRPALRRLDRFEAVALQAMRSRGTVRGAA